jgi:hypothetical protein|tara:strand:+ start:8366 stop:8614 length:249 start_codon:yes stop_codon:yes gene_type:complete
MKVRYWENVNGVFYKKNIDVVDGLKDSIVIEIEESGLKRKILIAPNGIKYKVVKQESVIDKEEIITSGLITYKQIEEISDGS